MGCTMQEDELAEIHVDGHDHPAFSDCQLKECAITRIRAQLTYERDIVALLNQPVGKTPAGTGVYKESHPPATETAARESPATTACA